MLAAHKIIFSVVLLILASQRIEDIVGWDLTTDTTKRGSLPSAVEYCILAWVAGLIWSEIKQLWDVGLKVRPNIIFGLRSCSFLPTQVTWWRCWFQEYASDLWNVVDFVTNSLYVATIGLRIRAFCDVSYLPCKLNLCPLPPALSRPQQWRLEQTTWDQIQYPTDINVALPPTSQEFTLSGQTSDILPHCQAWRD